MPADTLALVPLTAAQADALKALPELLELVRRMVPNAERPLSAFKAARLAKRRTASVIAALKSGALRGEFTEGTHGGRGHWKIAPADVAEWAARSA